MARYCVKWAFVACSWRGKACVMPLIDLLCSKRQAAGTGDMGCRKIILWQDVKHFICQSSYNFNAYNIIKSTKIGNETRNSIHRKTRDFFLTGLLDWGWNPATLCGVRPPELARPSIVLRYTRPAPWTSAWRWDLLLLNRPSLCPMLRLSSNTEATANKSDVWWETTGLSLLRYYPLYF